jgi:hypothetical protein
MASNSRSPCLYFPNAQITAPILKYSLRVLLMRNWFSKFQAKFNSKVIYYFTEDNVKYLSQFLLILCAERRTLKTWRNNLQWETTFKKGSEYTPVLYQVGIPAGKCTVKVRHVRKKQFFGKGRKLSQYFYI